MNKHEIFRFIDHTLLKQNAVWEQIREICQEGMDFGTASVCILSGIRSETRSPCR